MLTRRSRSSCSRYSDLLVLQIFACTLCTVYAPSLASSWCCMPGGGGHGGLQHCHALFAESTYLMLTHVAI